MIYDWGYFGCYSSECLFFFLIYCINLFCIFVSLCYLLVFILVGKIEVLK